MQNKKLSIVIGIPAYNEESNISTLLHQLLLQSRTKFRLKKIVVISDKSTDSTVNKAKKVKNSRIEVVSNKKRLGKAKIQNLFFDKYDADVFVLLDADILPVNSDTIDNLINPFYKNSKIGLTSGQIVPLAPSNLFEGVLEWSSLLKKNIFNTLDNGNNLYNCYGRIRAFRKEFAKQCKFPDTLSEDTFSYLSALSQGFKFQYVKSACVYYKLPQSLIDHLRQSARFQNGIQDLNKYFPKKLIVTAHAIPKKYIFLQFIQAMILNPIKACMYILIVFYTVLMKKFMDTSPMYIPSYSSKILKNI